ncbi:type 1 glutamine amidotransferase domain-containing protein [Desulfonatronum parangueonense]
MKIAAILTDYFEDVEYSEPVKAFREKGHEVVNVGLEAGKTVKGKSKQMPVEIDKAVVDVSPDDFDALLIPGGFSPDLLRAHEAPVDFVRMFMHSGKPVFSICHGPQLLITADVLQGRQVTGYKSIVQDIKNAGAKYQDSEVVVDGNLVSSRNPDDIPAFIRESVRLLE